jgi:hypothetical protein
MRPLVSAAPAGRVKRRFEAHRLARDCQARAYEQAVPLAVVADSILTPDRVEQDRVGQDRVEQESLQAKGVAA